MVSAATVSKHILPCKHTTVTSRPDSRISGKTPEDVIFILFLKNNQELGQLCVRVCVCVYVYVFGGGAEGSFFGFLFFSRQQRSVS